jgi:tRNA wybutosine-synthesizing protein 3
MDFEADKHHILGRKDQSNKGSIDSHILALVNSINSLSNFCTTSSCSGRIILRIAGKRKDESKPVFETHELCEESSVRTALDHDSEHDLNFMMESFILHIMCSDLDCAKNALDWAHNNGLKRAGLIGLSEHPVLELIGNDKIEFPLRYQGSLLMTDAGLRHTIELANLKLSKNHAAIGRLASAVSLLGR